MTGAITAPQPLLTAESPSEADSIDSSEPARFLRAFRAHPDEGDAPFPLPIVIPLFVWLAYCVVIAPIVG